MALLLMTTQGQIHIYWKTDSSLGRFQKGFVDINVYTKHKNDSKCISRIIFLLWKLQLFITQMIPYLEVSATTTLPFLCLLCAPS